jgi:G3E family GTPase
MPAHHRVKSLLTISEMRKQVALADVAILTKTDLLDNASRSALPSRLRKINPSMAMLEVKQGAISAGDLFKHARGDPKAGPEELQSWLQFGAFAGESDPQGGCNDGHAESHHHRNEPNRHGESINAYAISIDEPITREGLQLWLNSLVSLRGKDLLRVKGVVNLANEDRPVILQAVQHLVHPISYLSQWPDADHRSRVVFIVRNISFQAIQASLKACLGN